MLQTVRKWTQINHGQLGNHLGSISGVVDPFRGLWTAPKPDSGHSGADFDLPWPPLPTPSTQIDRNGLYRCPTNSTTYSMFNSHLLGAF